MARKQSLRELIVPADLLPVMNIMFLLIPALLLAMEFASMAEITIMPPKMCSGCSASNDMEPPVPLRLKVEIRSDGFALSTGNAAPQEIDLRDGGLDHAALAVMARKLKVTHPDEVSVTVTAENDVPMAKLVETLDTLRGEGCKLGGLARGEAPGPACLFYAAIIEA